MEYYFLKIKQITTNKKDFIDLLLLADEEERMIDKYLERGDVFALYAKNSVRSICVVTCEKNGVYEIKNMATEPSSQRMGYASYLIEYISSFYREKKSQSIIVGTGYGTSTVDFYKKCGFKESHIVKNFFTDNYINPIVEDGVHLVDMIYLKKEL